MCSPKLGPGAVEAGEKDGLACGPAYGSEVLDDITTFGRSGEQRAAQREGAVAGVGVCSCEQHIRRGGVDKVLWLGQLFFVRNLLDFGKPKHMVGYLEGDVSEDASRRVGEENDAKPIMRIQIDYSRYARGATVMLDELKGG